MTKRALALFAKNPAFGSVKTRLLSSLASDQVARLASAFLEDSSASLVRAAALLDAKPCLFYDPPTSIDAFRRFLHAEIAMYPQETGDLTSRLTAAYTQLAGEGTTAVCFIGADSPTLPHDYIAAGFSALDTGSEVVVGPSADGGYYLIGLRAAHPEIFEAIDWGTDRVCAQTQTQAERLGLPLHILPEWYDIDDEAGLERLHAELLDPSVTTPRGEDAPRTRTALASFFASDRMR